MDDTTNDVRRVIDTARRVGNAGPFTEDMLDGMDQADVAVTMNYLMQTRNKSIDAANRRAMRRAFWFVLVVSVLAGAAVEHVRIAIWANPISRLCHALEDASAAKSILEAVQKGSKQ